MECFGVVICWFCKQGSRRVAGGISEGSRSTAVVGHAVLCRLRCLCELAGAPLPHAPETYIVFTIFRLPEPAET